MESDSGGLLAPGGGWVQQGYVSHPAPASCLSFDPLEERLWATDNDGFLTSYALPRLLPYTSTRVAWVGDDQDAKHAVARWEGLNIRHVASARCV
jgi:hypothetical protein